MRTHGVVLMLVAGLLVSSSPRAAIDPAQAKVVVDDALRDAKDRPLALATLAWLDPSAHPEVAALARRRVIELGHPGFTAMRKALNRATPEKHADIVEALIEARAAFTTFIPPTYLAALEDVLWIGTREAKVMAIPQLASLGYRSSVLPIIDSAIEDPHIVAICVRALGTLADDRARFFLEQLLNEDDPTVRQMAAVSLAMIGGRAKQPLRNALRSDDRELRLTAARALLPVASEDEITVLYEYGTEYAEDDPATTRAVLEAAQKLEELWELRRLADAPGASDDDL